uniref:Uncharacterized protein n=1 Tax=Sphaeramia orbicularis TaxID=375764 RepID=A0A673BHG5_9TELE
MAVDKNRGNRQLMNNFPDLNDVFGPQRERNRGRVSELYLYLDECYVQWRCLEKERKKTEIILSQTFLGKWTAGEINPSLLKTPPNPTRLEHLVVNQLREQARVRVASLLDKMECLCSVHLHTNVHIALFRHLTAIYIVHARSKEELAHMSQHQRQANFTEERDTLKLVVALKDLVTTTSKLRTALARAVQKALPKLKRVDCTYDKHL